ncbi:MAG: ATP phosphoribosyltransferase [Sulfobacillus thermotolerans]|nr:ATP phosphoribosyltransferase [Sulfobacillus thermotolerans]
MVSTAFTMAVAKGRILQDAEALWQNSGWIWPVANGTRQLWFPPQKRQPGLIIARGRDILTMVRLGIADMGIVGHDILLEYGSCGLLDVADLKFAACRIVLAGQTQEWPQGPVRVASKYQNVSQKFFETLGHPVEIVPLSGSLELAPGLGIAPFIIDIVDTGQTLKEHHLVEIHTIHHSSARLIANPARWRTQRQLIEARNKLMVAPQPIVK